MLFIAIAGFVTLILSSCDISGRGSIRTDDLEEIVVEAEYRAGNFSEFEEFFEGFNANHIQNFHYFTSISDRSLVPGPTSFRIVGYFEIIEEFWDYYTESYSWLNRSPSATPNIPQLDYSFNWMASQSWNRTHIPNGVGGGFSICKENRIVFFSLGPN